MTYRGHVKQGVIVLDPPAQLPEGLEVEVRASKRMFSSANSGDGAPHDDEALVAGSIAAITAALPYEDFSNWEK
jgi:hypothetical protein